MFKQSYKNNIALLGASELFSFFGITSFWLLFLSQNGMTLFQIGLLESLFHGTSLVSEVPSGMLADRFTYKTNLFLSRLSTIFSSFLMLAGHGNFWIYALGMMAGAWSYNFDSGTSSAMLFESAKEAGLEEKYLKFTSFISGISEATRALGMVLAGLFVHGFLNITYMIQIGLSMLAILVISLMKEPKVKVQNEVSSTFSDIFKSVITTLKVNPKLIRWMLISQTLITFTSMFYFYYQNEMVQLQSWQISLMMLASCLINIFGVWMASKIGEKWTARQVFKIIIPISAFLFLLAILANPRIYIFIFLISDGLVAMFFPIYNNDIQQEFESHIRATMLSVNAMIGSLIMIFIFPLMGMIIDYLSFSISFMYLGIFLLLVSIGILKITE
ncbi:MFS transporter [Lactococcus lactis]|uniref:MFS transporter n=1 Tax=Lactococcus lactis TaxID=1358 RepID=A0AAW7IXZ2_9LACT|nr:MFS transporter [Lactococcus lactis]MDM7547476.1 MFS transporter [Lactococcus lactis]MRM59569.1 MFS transporter [Lactococcus cremoris]PST73159.1 MFS transporter [Lactococcus garvieae]